jgi:hypothetical protein
LNVRQAPFSSDELLAPLECGIESTPGAWQNTTNECRNGLKPECGIEITDFPNGDGSSINTADKLSHLFGLILLSFVR